MPRFLTQREEPRPPQLSDGARELLLEAAKDDFETIICLNTLGGAHVQTNAKQFNDGTEI